MQQFIGREHWLKRFQDYRAQEQGMVWRITGQPGIGKSTLLRRFAAECEKAEHPHTWLDMEGFAPAHGLEVLAALAQSAQFIDTEKTNKTLKEKMGEGFKTATGGLVSTLELFKDIIPAGELALGATKAVVGLAEGVAGNAAQLSEQADAAHPELYLLNALAAAAKDGRKPVCLMDTYEHILNPHLKIKSRLMFMPNQARDAQEKEWLLAEWLAAVWGYLSSKGWRIVLVGRSIPRSLSEDNLPRFSRTEILEAAKTRAALQSYLPEHEAAMVGVLGTLSFEGNPLWLQVAMNLLENLLAEGKDLEQLAMQPDELQACFEEENPLDINSFEGIEHGSCKLGLIQTLTRSIAGLEDQAWKIALPRVLDKGIVQQLFDPTQANAILHNFKIAGVFRVSGQQFSLHEEIRDLLLAYAHNKGWLETDETRALHDKLWNYLNEFYLGKLPEELRSKINREGLRGDVDHIDALNAQLAKHFALNWLLEACYHRAMSLSELPAPTIKPSMFWQQVSGSASLAPLDKWCLMEKLPDLSVWQIVKLSENFSDELKIWTNLFGATIAQALYQTQLAGHIGALSNLEFWEKRIREHGLAGDYFGFQDALSELYPERCQEIRDALLERYGQSDDPQVQLQCAKALYKKGGTLGRMSKLVETVTCYDELITRYAQSANPKIQAQCLNASANKIEPLLVLGKTPEAIQSIQQVLNRISPNDQSYPIMQFLLWLADPATPLNQVLNAIRGLAPDVKLDWSWEQIRPYINQLPEPRKAIAECFIAYFEQHQDRERLESELQQLQAFA